ncbi:MAG: 4'-phosphopantetheinyl transferase superfamily protein [Bacteroidota bacterium]|jgi:phosphopantetheinyl transferase|nr:4'-phosphopantetheinyl transferase superfamily protein [Bacteroidota bacterium]
MLIRREHIDPGGLLGIWKIEETREELLNYFPEPLRSEAIDYIKKIRSIQRAMEWLATRAMLFVLVGDDKSILNYPDGRPYLSDRSHLVSLSHTKEYAALLLHNSLPIGIDIEARSERVKKIANKFISEKEYIDPNNKVLHQLLHWSAKETLFKRLNLREVDFKEHLFLYPFIPCDKGTITATESRTDSSRRFTIHYEVHDDYVLTWTIGSNK